MKKTISVLLVFIMLLVPFTACTAFAKEDTTMQKENTTIQKEEKIITYLPCWASRPWKVEDIQGDKLTHIFLSFARIDNNFEISDKEMRIHVTGGGAALPDIVSADMIIPETWDKVAKLKEKYPKLKIIVAVGGWEADGFSDMVASAPTREIFVDSVVKYVKEHNLDGVDLDWEFPVNGAWGVIKSRPEDKENFTALMSLLRSKLGGDKEISFCANVSGWFFDVVDFPSVMPLVNSVNIMAYDMRGSWDDAAFHSAALYRNPAEPQDWGLSVAETVDRFLKAGISKDQIVLGVPTYGHEYRNVKPGKKGDGLFQPFTSEDKGTWVSSIPYNYLRDYYINKNGFKRYFDDVAKVPYLYDGKTFISYEDAESLKAKCEYIKEKDLAGVMYWEYVNDIDGELLTVMSENLK